MESILTILGKYQTPQKKEWNPSERDLIIGELFNKMTEEDKKDLFYINKNGVKKKRNLWTIKRFASHMAPHSTEQLYFLRSICNDYQKRGGRYGKCLLGAVKKK